MSLLPSGGQRPNYQTDPRPHFGVAWSSHSTCRPLWGSEGPCWGQRTQEASDQTHTCPHCHLGMDSDALRWHEVGTDISTLIDVEKERKLSRQINLERLLCSSLRTGQVSSVRWPQELKINGVSCAENVQTFAHSAVCKMRFSFLATAC